jgi:hypothetical protein
MSTSIIHHLIATLKMPSKWPDRILRAQTVQTKLTGNTNFPVGSWPANIITLAQLGIDITTPTTGAPGCNYELGRAASLAVRAQHRGMRAVYLLLRSR